MGVDVTHIPSMRADWLQTDTTDHPTELLASKLRDGHSGRTMGSGAWIDPADPTLEAAIARDGTAVHLQLLRRDERELVARFFTGLSAESRRRRFLQPMPRLPEAMLRRLAAVDGRHHVAVVAEVDGQCVGIARWIALADEPGTAEVAVPLSRDTGARAPLPSVATSHGAAPWADPTEHGGGGCHCQQTTPAVATAPGRRQLRLLAAAAAVLAAEALWGLAELGFGLDLRAPATASSPQPADIGPPVVAVGSGAAALAAWGLLALLALLEQLTARARTIWTVTAAVVLVASLGGPLSGSGITAANRAVLVLPHLAVGTVLIPALRRTAASRAGRPA